MVDHVVQPEGPTVQVWASPPKQRVAPLVQALVHATHEPLLHALIAWQLVVVHVVQPEGPTLHDWRWPFAVHICAPLVHASRQQVAVRCV